MLTEPGTYYQASGRPMAPRFTFAREPRFMAPRVRGALGGALCAACSRHTGPGTYYQAPGRPMATSKGDICSPHRRAVDKRERNGEPFEHYRAARL